MRTLLRCSAVFIYLALFAGILSAAPGWAQSGSTSGTVTGTVADPTGAVVPGATVKIQTR